MRREDPVLLGAGEARKERHDLGGWQPQPGQCVGDVTDLALAGEEDQDVAAATVTATLLGPQLLDRVAHSGHIVDVALGAVPSHSGQWPVADLDRVGPPGDLDDRRGRAVSSREMRRERVGVDRGRGDDDLEVRAARQEVLEITEQEVDIETALVRLVDDDGVVAPQVAVSGEFGEQDAVGHHLDERVAIGLLGEPHLVTDDPTEVDAQLFGEPLGDSTRGDPPRLGVPDHAVNSPPDVEADLGNLGRLARAGLPGDDDHLVVADEVRDLLARGRHRQVGWVGQLRDPGRPPRSLLVVKPMP